MRGRRRWTILQFLKFFPHVYEYHLQCVFTFFASISFNFFFYKSWSQSLLLIADASFNSSLSHCCLIFTNFYFNFQNRTYNETLLHYEVNEFFFSTSPYSPKIDSEQESYVHFIPALQSVPNFRMRSVQSFCHISLYGSSNSLILGALEWEFHGASEYQFFLPCLSMRKI